MGYKGKGGKTETFISLRNQEYPTWERKKEMPVSELWELKGPWKASKEGVSRAE